jgi:hypothetical protein
MNGLVGPAAYPPSGDTRPRRLLTVIVEEDIAGALRASLSRAKSGRRVCE